MTLTSHYLVGVGAAIVFKNPLLALPVAFASHFVLDALPHYGVPVGKSFRGKSIIRTSLIDVPVFIFGVILTFYNYPAWYFISGIIAYSPDLAWIYRFTLKEKFGKIPPAPSNALNAFHSTIQKHETERWWGILIEACLAVLLLGLLFL
jgi:hypothetical protein